MGKMEAGNEVGSKHFPVIATLRCGGPKHGWGKKEGISEREL